MENKTPTILWMAPTIIGPLIGIIVTAIILFILIVPMLDAEGTEDAGHEEPGITQVEGEEGSEGGSETGSESDPQTDEETGEPFRPGG
ncbi:MAG: hypothetical protein GYB66_07425 [Chloroflexi bacterium]|nr:hypothetical protein [Chloroflexota bacterium]